MPQVQCMCTTTTNQCHFHISCACAVLEHDEGTSDGPNRLPNRLVSDDEVGGICGLVIRCLQACNRDVRGAVTQHVIVVGGGSHISGLPLAVVVRVVVACSLYLPSDPHAHPQLLEYCCSLFVRCMLQG
jgi:hypothetical protein